MASTIHFDTIGSTQDAAHEAAANGASAGTVIVAEAQTAGRGRMGRTWRSEKGAGVWLTVIERPSPDAIELLSIRVGLNIARALAPRPIRLKWPNDLMLDDRKLGGILIEARWRDERLEWVAIGVGLNLAPPAEEPQAIGLGSGTPPADILAVVIPAIRAAAACVGPLSVPELADYEARDWARGRHCAEPVAGIVAGIDASGALLIDAASGRTAVRSGSLVLDNSA
jgi:BirA family biotin operon repressor/biotin-[acetyl-CoA-carboxylase] ligase